MSISTGKIAEIVSGLLIGSGDIQISKIFIDSRKATLISPDSLFVALPGSRSDGHSFIETLYENGIRAFMIHDSYKLEEIQERCKDASFIVTKNTLDSLQLIAADKRQNFKGTVIAITGSNGKTIVKEWFSDILGKVYSVLRSPRSYNSQTGVPLSVLNLNDRYEYAVFEAGMSQAGEIKKLEKIIRPDIGVITNIGDAHQENFTSIEAKIREKLALFINCETIIYCPDQEEIDILIRESEELKNKELFTWSFDGAKADVQFKIVPSPGGVTNIEAYNGDRRFTIKLPYSDKASIQNSAIVITMLLKLKVSDEIIKEQVEAIRPVEMRMEQKEGINGCTLIEDYYNSDPAALGIALDHLKDLPGKSKKVIISDFVQQRLGDNNLYLEVADMISKAGVNSTICVGDELIKARSYFSEETLFFRSTDELLKWYTPGYFKNDVVLIKGARKFEFERISSLLELKAHITTLEINLNSLLHNLNEYRSKLSPGVFTMAMVKAFAYGAGPKQISEWLVSNGVDFLAVAYTDEGIMLREAGISSRIMVMNPDPSSFRLLIDNDLEPEIFSIDILKRFLSEAERQNIYEYPVHIKIDTGMHRLGFLEDDIAALKSLLLNEKRIKVASVFSHLAASEDPGYDRETRKQAGNFKIISSEIENFLGYKLIRHLVNSGGILRFPEYHFEMVRLGIGLFGTGYNDIAGAEPVISFKSSISQLKIVKAGEGIGYGLTDVSDSDREIAIIPIGYADGLNRRMGNGNGRVFVKSGFVPIVGKICMDMCMIDVTSKGLVPGDRVEIFGSNISVTEVADKCETIAYEIITAIPPRVKRVYLFE